MAIPEKVRAAVKAMYGGHCAYCGCKPDKLQVDHVKAKVAGGTDDPSNLKPACFACNNLKIFHSLETFRHEVQNQVARARKYSVNFRTAERFGFFTVHQPEEVLFYFEKIEGERHDGTPIIQ